MDLLLTAVVEGQRRSWPVTGDLLRIGRSSRCEIQLADATVSKEHAEVCRSTGGWLLRDLGSRNGTRLNGVEVRDTGVTLKEGDSIQFGQVEVRFGAEQAANRTRFSESTGLGSAVRQGAKEIISRAGKGSDGSRLVALLAEAGQMLVLPRPLRETCEEVLRVVERAVPASRLVILLRDKKGDAPAQIAVRHLGVPTREPLALSTTILNTVLDDCQSVVTRDASEDPRFSAPRVSCSSADRGARAPLRAWDRRRRPSR